MVPLLALNSIGFRNLALEIFWAYYGLILLHDLSKKAIWEHLFWANFDQKPGVSYDIFYQFLAHFVLDFHSVLDHKYMAMWLNTHLPSNSSFYPKFLE